ncbi:MAG: ribonuclease P protein component [Proteobacteria bacterium]|nr:ribonuclease P protein component [Pseudomonadota bacterium]
MNAFPKSVRLHHQIDFRRTFDDGRKVVSESVVLYLRQRSEPEAAPLDCGGRVGLVVSRKVGNAVVRNRVKRYLREAYRLLRPELAQFASLWSTDLIVVARASAAQASSAEMADALQLGLRRLKRQLEA